MLLRSHSTHGGGRKITGSIPSLNRTVTPVAGLGLRPQHYGEQVLVQMADKAFSSNSPFVQLTNITTTSLA